MVNPQYKLFYPIRHFRNFLNKKVRLDGRPFEKQRPIAVNCETFSNSVGSSAAKIGNSNVVCGIRAEISKPKETAPECGYIIPNVDLSFASLPANTNQELPALLSCLTLNILTDSQCIKLEDLCIEKKRFVWTIYIDLICLEFDGSILDTILMSCVTALNSVKLPKATYDQIADSVKISEEKVKLTINANPVITTFSVFEDALLTDPTLEEESMSGAVMQCGLYRDTFGIFHKRGGVPIKKKDIDSAISIVPERLKELESILMSIT